MKHPWRVLGLAVAPLLWATAAVAQPSCECLRFSGLDLLQRGKGSRPRDCTCINGASTSPTTPRDTLKAMGAVALRSHLEKCERERKGLEQQKASQVAMGKDQLAKIDKRLKRQKDAVAKLKNATKSDRAGDKAKLKELNDKAKAHEKRISELKTEYNKAYTKWYDLTKQVTAKSAALSGCECKEKTAMIESQVVARHGLTPDEKTMYDRIQKVEECETKRMKLSDEIQASMQKVNAATMASDDQMGNLEQRQADEKHYADILSKKSMVKAVEKRNKLLEPMVSDEEKRLKQQKDKNAQLEKQLGELDTELKACGC